MKAPAGLGLISGDGILPASPVCTECKQKIDGWLQIDRRGNIIDSGGFMWFTDGAICDACLVEKYGNDGTEMYFPPWWGLR